MKNYLTQTVLILLFICLSVSHTDAQQLSDNFLKELAPSAVSAAMYNNSPAGITVGNDTLVFKKNAAGTLRAENSDITAELVFNPDKKFNAVSYQIILKNRSANSVTGIRVDPFRVPMFIDHEKVKPAIRYMSGGYHYDALYPPRAYQLQERVFMTNDHAKPVSIGAWGQETRPGSSFEYVPMIQFAIMNRNHLSGFMAGFEWSGGWTLNAGWEKPVYTGPDTSRFIIDGSMYFGDFTLKPGQTIQLPKVHMVFFEGDSWEVLENAQKRYIADGIGYKIKKQPNYNKVSYDHWFGIHGSFDIDDMMRQAKKSAELGVEYFCLDAGWYGAGSFGASNTGKWDEPDPVKFPNGIADVKKLSDFCRENKMGFGIWHDIDTRNGTKQLMDYAKEEDRQEALNVLRKWVKQWNVTWIRWEMTAGGKLHGLEYWLGYYSIMDTLLKEFPDLLIECCYGGGTRFDLGMATRTVTTWINDHTADADVNRFMQTGALRFWPSYFLNMAVRVHRNSGDKEATAYNIISRMAGTPSFNGDIAQWSEPATKMARQLVDKFKSVRHLQSQPAYFPLEQPVNVRDYDIVCYGNGESEQQLLYTFNISAKGSVYVELPGGSKPWLLVMSSKTGGSIKKSGKGYEVDIPAGSAAVWKR